LQARIGEVGKIEPEEIKAEVEELKEKHETRRIEAGYEALHKTKKSETTIQLDEKCGKCNVNKVQSVAAGVIYCPKCHEATWGDIIQTQRNWNKKLPVEPKLGMLFCIWWDLRQICKQQKWRFQVYATKIYEKQIKRMEQYFERLSKSVVKPEFHDG